MVLSLFRMTGWINCSVKEVFKEDKVTFIFVLNLIRHFYIVNLSARNPFSPEEQLVITLFRLATGDFGGILTVCEI